MAKMTGELEKYISAIRKASYRAGGYPGVPQDLVPVGIADTLKRLNVIEDFVPFNPSHKSRWVITDAYRATLEERNG